MDEDLTIGNFKIELKSASRRAGLELRGRGKRLSLWLPGSTSQAFLSRKDFLQGLWEHKPEAHGTGGEREKKMRGGGGKNVMSFWSPSFHFLDPNRDLALGEGIWGCGRLRKAIRPQVSDAGCA